MTEMENVGHVWRVVPGRAAEYDRRHADVLPELEQLMRQAGVRRYSIYRWGEIVFSHMEVEDYARLVADYADDPVAARWEAAFADVLEFPGADPETGWPERLTEVWSLGAL
jgi:L-rhamnose mutarotase